MANTRRIFSSGRYIGEVDELGRFCDASGKYIGEVDEHGRFFDQSHTYKGEIDDLGRCFSEKGLWLGDGTDSFFNTESTEKPVQPETPVPPVQPTPVVSNHPISSKIMYSSKFCFIKWMIILAIAVVIGLSTLKLGGIAFAYVLVTGIYGGGLTNISLLDAAADATEYMGGSFFAGIGGTLRLCVAFCTGFVLFPIHAVKAIIAIVRGEI